MVQFISAASSLSISISQTSLDLEVKGSPDLHDLPAVIPGLVWTLLGKKIYLTPLTSFSGKGQSKSRFRGIFPLTC